MTVRKTVLKYFPSSADVVKSIALIEGSQDPPICSEKNSIKMKINTELWWNGNGRGNPKYWERHLSLYHFVHHKSDMYCLEN
jgi:hypothetical protein